MERKWEGLQVRQMIVEYTTDRNVCLAEPNLNAVKRLTSLILATFGLGLAAQAQELPVGTLAENAHFALFDSGDIANTSLTAFENQVIVLYYYTPW